MMRQAMAVMLATGMVFGVADQVRAGESCCARARKAASQGPFDMLGTQTYTFRLFTLFEAIDKAHQLGLRYIEAFPGQVISKETGEARMGHDLSPELIERIKAHLENRKVQMVGYGVIGFPKEEAECRRIFEFVRKMGVITITAEPEESQLPMLDKLAQEYGINIAIHNHPKPSRYWDPETVARVIKDLSPRVGACADTGHWLRSGLCPLESLKKLEGRILWLHFKDLGEKGKPEAHDVIWGTGVAQAKDLLAELKRQGFRGGIMVEYEHNWENSVPDIAKCIEFFQKTAKGLDGSPSDCKAKADASSTR